MACLMRGSSCSLGGIGMPRLSFSPAPEAFWCALSDLLMRTNTSAMHEEGGQKAVMRLVRIDSWTEGKMKLRGEPAKMKAIRIGEVSS